jgi:hypothetical protein
MQIPWGTQKERAIIKLPIARPSLIGDFASFPIPFTTTAAYDFRTM